MSLVETRYDRPFLSYRAPRIAVVDRWRVRPRIVAKEPEAPPAKPREARTCYTRPIIIARPCEVIPMKDAAFPIYERKFPNPMELAKAIADKHGLTIDDLRGPRRQAKYIAARFEAIDAFRAQLPHWSLPMIGRFFNRDHTSVLSAIRKLRRQSDGV